MILCIFLFTLFIYHKSLSLPLGEMINLFTTCTFLTEKGSRDAPEKMQNSSCFQNLTTSMQTAPVFSGMSFQDPAVQCSPIPLSFMPISCHGANLVKEGHTHSWTCPLAHSPSCFLPVYHLLTSNSNLTLSFFSFQPGSDHLSHKASFLHLGIIDIWGQMIPCCGWLSCAL